MKRIQKAIFLIFGILTLILIELDPMNSIGVIKMMRTKVKGISVQIPYEHTASTEKVQFPLANLE